MQEFYLFDSLTVIECSLQKDCAIILLNAKVHLFYITLSRELKNSNQQTDIFFVLCHLYSD